MKKIVVIFFGWLIVVNIFGLAANNRVNLSPDTAYSWINPQYTFQKQDWDVVGLHSRWDSYWYLDIAKNGYKFAGEKQLSNIVFFPLYPLLLKSIGSFLNTDYVLSGWTISAFFAFLSSFYLYKIVKEFHPKSDPFLAVLMLFSFPTAFFLNAIYTESTFLFFSLAFFYHTLKKQYFRASLFGFFASLTRLTGILLFLPILIEYIKENRKNIFHPGILQVLLIPLGTLLFFLYHFMRFGDIFIFFKVENWWGRGFTFNTGHFAFIGNPSVVNFSLDASFAIFSIVAMFIISRRLRLSYGVYIFTTLLVALTSGTLMSIGRYILVLFPIYILGASLKDKTYTYLWIFASTLFLALYILLFVNHYWAG